MQICDSTQSSDASTEIAASARLGTGSGGARDATRSDAISGDGMGAGKAASTIAESPRDAASSRFTTSSAFTASSPFTTSMGATSMVPDVAGLPSTGGAVTSARNKPKSTRASVSQPATMAVPHNATTTAPRRALITAYLPVPAG